MNLIDYLNACNANIKAGKIKRAKQALDKALDIYNQCGATKPEYNMLYWLGNNFYHWTNGKQISFSEKGAYYEGKILAMQNN